LDPAPVAAHRFLTIGLLSRRAATRRLSGALAALAIARVPHTALAQIATPRPPVEGAIFVGPTSDPDTLIAVAMPPDKPEVDAYLCDGHDLAIWYTGPVKGAEPILDAGDEGFLNVRFSDTSASGAATLADGRSLSFVAAPAMGIAGLYDVTLASDELIGVGTSGQQMRGRLVETLPDGRELLAGTIELADGTLRAFAAFLSGDAAGDFRLIALNDGQMKGAGKTGQGKGWVDVTAPASGTISRSRGIA
jgi:hypothetical protein